MIGGETRSNKTEKGENPKKNTTVPRKTNRPHTDPKAPVYTEQKERHQSQEKVYTKGFLFLFLFFPPKYSVTLGVCIEMQMEITPGRYIDQDKPTTFKGLRTDTLSFRAILTGANLLNHTASSSQNMVGSLLSCIS